MKMATFRNCESKLGLLLTLLRTHPVEFSDRIRIYIEGRYERRKRERDRPQAIGMDTLTTLLLQFVNWDLESAFQETAMRQIESHIHRQKCGSNGNRPFDPLHSADLTLARFCYAVCRSLSPTTVIETGVAYGVTTSYVLQALTQNQRGSLLSIDLPPLCPMADKYVGLYVPQELRTVWRLERGVTRRHLPGLLARVRTVDVFIHDSLHTCSNMTWEFETVWPHLQPGGVLIADDVQDQPAFQDFVTKARPQFSAVVTEERKDAMFGVAVKGA